ncbi:MAG: hypothetical protein CMK70_06815 [Pseudohongiella sp.]|nr:hypothetical protein [Pseudohongiella sp.]|tara:strand:+ start:4950 stop:5462 length:513 start_codon:yes stop_codon:yes gene_type:complete
MGRILRLAAVLPLITALVACGGDSEPSGAAASEADYTLTLSMAELMAHVLEPVADSLWRSAGWIDDEIEGYYELYPTTDEGWHQAEERAALIVEIGNSLMLPGRAVDNDSWATYSKAMSTVGLNMMQAAEQQDEEEFFQTGAQLYSVCTACHQSYSPDIAGRFAPSSLTQ